VWRVRWVGHVARMGDMRSTVFLLENLKEETTWKTKHKWRDSIRMYLTKRGEYVGWMHLAQNTD